MSKVVGLVSVAGFAAISGCAADPEIEQSVDGTEGPTGTVSQPLKNLNNWSVDALVPQNGLLEGTVRSRATFKSNSTTSYTQRRVGTVLATRTGTATCNSDQQCDPNGGQFCLQMDGSSSGQKFCYTPVAANVGEVITLAAGQSTTLTADLYVATGISYYSVGILNADTGFACASLTGRQDPTKCARSLSGPFSF